MTTKRKRSPIGGAPTIPGHNRIAIRDRPDRARIEFELAAGHSVRAIARKYDCHEGALFKFRKKLPPQLKAAYISHLLAPGVDLEKLKTQESEGLLQSLAQQRARLLIVQDAEMETGNSQAVATIANAVHRNLELVGRYLGELQQHHVHTNISVLVTKEYLELRTALLRALAPFPEARRCVAETLHALEDGVARRTAPAMIDVTPAALPKPA
jgi:transposase-like protein